jgi:hypothetical protein
MTQCAWCPFDCPSPEVAPCAPGEAQGGPLQGSPQEPEAPVTPPAPRARYKPLRRLTDVIRDIADYQEGTTP